MTRIRNKTALILVLLGILVLSVVYLFRNIGPGEHWQPSQLVLNRGLVGEPENLDPHNFSTNQARAVLRDIGEGLLTYDADGQLTGGVAHSWSISEDGLKYFFTLRGQARWSNGDPITAEDFVRSFRMLADPRNGSRNAASIEMLLNGTEIISGQMEPRKLGIKAISDKELEIHLSSPTPYFAQLLTHPSMYPVYSRSESAARNKKTKRISNGAYVLKDWIVGSEIRLTKNEAYRRASHVHFESVVYHIVRESAEVNRFRAGELDITDNVPSGDFADVQKEFSDQLKVSPYLGVYYYGFNLKNSKFTKAAKLRKALSLAIDRKVLVEKVTRRGEKPAYGWVPPGVANYDARQLEDLMLAKSAREELARKLYKESGFGPDNSLQFELRYNDSDVQQRIALAIQSMWQEVLGAEATLVSEEFKVLLSSIRMEDVTELFRLSWTGDYNDPQSFLQVFESDNPSNLTGYSNVEYDEIMRRASLTTDMDERSRLLQLAESLVLSDNAVIPLYFYVSKHLVSDRIVGWSNNVLNVHPSQYLRPANKSN